MFMKKKIRILTVNEILYLYSTSVANLLATEESIFTMRIFIDKYSKYALFVHFRTLDDYHAGNPLNGGTFLYNELLAKEVIVNLHRPLFVRQALDYGLSQGWNPKLASLELDGLPLLVGLGYDIQKLLLQDKV